MTRPADQIALPLDWPQVEDETRFIVGDANREAFDHFRALSLWPVRTTLLTGPPRSGRSLLARAFVLRTNGRIIDRADAQDEEMLFHAWNAAQDSGRPLVLIVDEVPPAWDIQLPDLRTRLAVTPVARIAQPDDELFRALIALLFSDRGLHIPDEAVSYVSSRIERSYWAAERVVEAIDRFAIAERARLTLPTVRRALIDAGLVDARGAA